jgi:hypothetical protein
MSAAKAALLTTNVAAAIPNRKVHFMCRRPLIHEGLQSQGFPLALTRTPSRHCGKKLGRLTQHLTTRRRIESTDWSQRANNSKKIKRARRVLRDIVP